MFLLLVSASVRSQVILIPEVQTGGIVLKQQIWSVVVNNLSGETKRAYLSISVTDRNTSQPLLQANSGVILFNAGVKRVTYNELSPLSYSVASASLGLERQLNQPLPAGEYLVCYKLIETNKNFVIATECVKITAEPLSPPQLILPENEAVILEPRPVLTWTPPAPVYMFNSLSYDIIVSPVYDKQSPQEALQRNIPVMTTMSVNNSILYPPSFTDLLPGKTYAWQVVAKDAANFGGKSEVWTFTVMPDSVKKIISDASYIKLSMQDNEVTVLHQNVLKMEYVNSLADTMVKVDLYRVSDGNNKGKQKTSFQLPVKAGQNFLEYRIRNGMRLDETAVYEAKLTNGRNEYWYMRFIPKYYF